MKNKKILLTLAATAALGLFACNTTTNSSSAASSSSNESSAASSSEASSSSSETATSSSSSAAAVQTISDITKVGTYAVKGVVVAITTKGFVIHDGTAGILVFQNAAPSVSIGDYVKVTQTLDDTNLYNGFYQFTAGATVAALNKANAPAIPAAVDLTKAVADSWAGASFAPTAIQKYKWTTTCGLSGTYTTLPFADSTVAIENTYTPTSLAVTSGKKYQVEAYFYGYATKYSYASVALTSVKEVVDAPESVQISGNDSVQATKTITLTASVLPSTAAQTITWSSETPSIATVDQSGVVTGVAEGSAVIKAVSSVTTVFAEKTITVTPAPADMATAIAVTSLDSSTSLKVGSTLLLSASVTPTTADQSVTWSSSDTGVATVDSTGLVTGVADGAVTIIATAADGSKVTGSIDLTVTVDNLKTFAELNASFDTTTIYAFKGVVLANDGSELLVGDADGSILVYSKTYAASFSAGDFVLVVSTLKVYNNTLETAAIATMTLAKSGTAPTVATAPTDVTAAELDTLGAATSHANAGKFIRISEAKLFTSGSYTNLAVNGATKFVGAPKAAKGTTLPDVGVWGTFEAYVLYNNNSSFLTTIVVTKFTADQTQTADPAAVAVTAAGNVTTLGTGKTLQMSAVVSPFKASQTVTWTVANKDTSVTDPLATISSAGLLTAGTVAGTVVVTATSSNASVLGTAEIQIVALNNNYSKVAKYSFASTSTEDGTKADGQSAVFGLFTATGVCDTTALQVVTSVTAASNVYGSSTRGMKIGTSSAIGSFTLAIDPALKIVKIEAEVCSYKAKTNGVSLGTAQIVTTGTPSAADSTGNVASTIEFVSDSVLSSAVFSTLAKSTSVSGTTTDDPRVHLISMTFYSAIV